VERGGTIVGGWDGMGQGGGAPSPISCEDIETRSMTINYEWLLRRYDEFRQAAPESGWPGGRVPAPLHHLPPHILKVT
jgi:hypothetical protein